MQDRDSANTFGADFICSAMYERKQKGGKKTARQKWFALTKGVFFLLRARMYLKGVKTITAQSGLEIHTSWTDVTGAHLEYKECFFT